MDVLRAAGFPIQTGHVPYDITSNAGVFKVDHNIGNDHRLTMRYNFATGYNENVEAWGGQVARSRGAALRNRDDMGAGSLTTLLSSRAVNELRFQIARRDPGQFRRPVHFHAAASRSWSPARAGFRD